MTTKQNAAKQRKNNSRPVRLDPDIEAEMLRIRDDMGLDLSVMINGAIREGWKPYLAKLRDKLGQIGLSSDSQKTRAVELAVEAAVDRTRKIRP